MTEALVALTWWGTWPYSQVTVGDVMSVAAVASGLRQRGISFHIVHREKVWDPTYRIPGFSGSEVWFDEIDPGTYRACLFICGPLPTDWPEGRERLFAFCNARRLAVGVTLASPTSREPAERVFNTFLARDGFDRQWMDLALSCDWPVRECASRTDEVALCLRGKEDYYGDDDASTLVEAIMESGLNRQSRTKGTLDTVLLKAEDDPRMLEAQFAAPAGVVTTRLHGSLLSLRNGTPWIAVDQVVGGKKVRSMNEQLGWPLNFAAEDLSLSSFERALDSMQDPVLLDRLEEVRERAVRRSFETRAAALDWVEETLAT